MTTPNEQVAHVESALRQRFFGLVPRIDGSDRVGWREEQHDTDRLSRALAAYSLVGLCAIDDEAAAEAITDGQGDCGIDALYFDRPRQRLVIVQAKYKRTGTSPSQDECLKTINGIRALRSRRFDMFNMAIQDRLDEIEGYLFEGFERCLYDVVRFQSDTERILAVILDHDSLRWFRPARGQFQLYYRWGADHPEYQPDFVAETADTIYMLETKMQREMDDAEVLAKRDAAVLWCRHASAYTTRNGSKPWKYVLIPHPAVNEGDISGLARATVRRLMT